MKYCMHCGKQIEDDAFFCIHCGKQVFDQKDTPPEPDDKTQDNTLGNNGMDSVYGNQYYQPQPPKGNAGLIIAIGTIVIILAVAILGGAVFFVRQGMGPIQMVQNMIDPPTTSSPYVITTEDPYATTEDTWDTTTEDTWDTTTEYIEPTTEAASDEYILPNSSSEYLSSSDVSGLSAWELRIARNEIYARHGRRFSKQDLQDYFDSKSWYNGTIAADEFERIGDAAILSDLERANVRLIESYEHK